MPLDARSISVIIRFALGAVLLVSSGYKLKDRSAYEMAVFVASGPFRRFYKQIGAIGLTLELIVGAALLVDFYPVITALACVVLMLIFDAALISLRLSGYEGGCGCFGSRSSGAISVWHFARNVLLSLAAGFLLFLKKH
jgi:hypothetical protein